MKLMARKRLRYGNKVVMAGEVFDAKPADVRILLAIQHADEYVEPPPKRVAAVFKPIPAEVTERIEAMRDNGSVTDAQAEQLYEHHATHAPMEHAKPHTKRAYKRRDMTAE